MALFDFCFCAIAVLTTCRSSNVNELMTAACNYEPLKRCHNYLWAYLTFYYFYLNTFLLIFVPYFMLQTELSRFNSFE